MHPKCLIFPDHEDVTGPLKESRVISGKLPGIDCLPIEKKACIYSLWLDVQRSESLLEKYPRITLQVFITSCAIMEPKYLLNKGNNQ